MSSVHSLHRTRSAVTEWIVENAFGLPTPDNALVWVTWLRVSPRTGRTHQIRVHLADQGFPVIRDQVYGRRRKYVAKNDDSIISRVNHFSRQALHAEKLRFIHPRTDRAQEFTAPWFKDMRDLFQLLNEECVEKMSERYYRG